MSIEVEGMLQLPLQKQALAEKKKQSVLPCRFRVQRKATGAWSVASEVVLTLTMRLLVETISGMKPLDNEFWME